MLGWFRKRNRARASAVQLYGSSVAQARAETFYASWRVPDTDEGRYEVISLHLCLLALRLQLEGEEGGELARLLFETFMTDLDDNMREQGVSDLKVPGHVRKAATGLYDRFGAYRQALLASDNAALEQALEVQFATLDANADSRAIAAYMRDSDRLLASQPAELLYAGVLRFPLLPG